MNKIPPLPTCRSLYLVTYELSKHTNHSDEADEERMAAKHEFWCCMVEAGIPLGDLFRTKRNNSTTPPPPQGHWVLC